MSFEYLDEGYFARPLGGLGSFGIVPLVYVAATAAIAAGALVAEWLSKDDWSVGEYNANMDEMYHTILLWDQIGWKKGCWTDAARRARWKLFMDAFGKHYADHGKISGASFVSDSEELPARDFAKRLAAWGDELNASCALDVPSTIPPTPEKPTDPGEYIKWGAWLVGGILALNVISSVRNALPASEPPRRSRSRRY